MMKNNIEGQLSLFDTPYTSQVFTKPVKRERTKKPARPRVYQQKHLYRVYWYEEILMEVEAYSEKQANKICSLLKGKYGTYVQLIH